MKLAVLIQCHKNPEQINQLIEVLSHPDIDIIIHIDKKSSIKDKIHASKNVSFVPDSNRVDVKWGTFSQVDATLELLKTSMKQYNYDYYMLISGQDFPLVSADQIVSFFSDNRTNYINLFESLNYGANKSTNYDKRNEIVFKDWMFGRSFLYRIIRRFWVQLTGGYTHTFKIFKRKNSFNLPFYFGSSWWCLTGETVNYIMDYLKKNQDFITFLRKSSCPDECIFQTLVMNSPFSNDVSDYIHYVDWSEGKSSPKTLLSTDLDAMFQSEKLMARKVDMDVDKNIINEMLIRINKQNEEKHGL